MESELRLPDPVHNLLVGGMVCQGCRAVVVGLDIHSPHHGRCAVMPTTSAGASRGVGYAAAKKLCEKFPGATIYLTSKNQNITPELNARMREEFPGASEHCEYVNMDVNDDESVYNVMNMIRLVSNLA